MNIKLLIIIGLIPFVIGCKREKKTYYNDHLVSIETIVDGKKNGEAIYYDTLGNIEVKGSFKNDLRDGYFEEYQNGVIFAKTTYKIGKAEGESYRYKNGKLNMCSFFRNDSILLIRMYDSIGNIKAEVYYKDEKANGPVKFYKNGKIWISGYNMNGKMVGDEIYYDENGKIVKVVPAK